MDYRQTAFSNKFKSASEHLDTNPEQIVSIKVRGKVYNYEDYNLLLEKLTHLIRVQPKAIQGDFQGNAYIVSDHRQRVIIVEHETGLEILYVAASIASLVGLVPTILQLWNTIRTRKSNKSARYQVDSIEIRYLDSKGRLLEDKQLDIISYYNFNSILPILLFQRRLEELDNSLQQYINDVEHLKQRVQAMEKSFSELLNDTNQSLGKIRSQMQEIRKEQDRLNELIKEILEKLHKKKWFFLKFRDL